MFNSNNCLNFWQWKFVSYYKLIHSEVLMTCFKIFINNKLTVNFVIVNNNLTFTHSWEKFLFLDKRIKSNILFRYMKRLLITSDCGSVKTYHISGVVCRILFRTTKKQLNWNIFSVVLLLMGGKWSTGGRHFMKQWVSCKDTLFHSNNRWDTLFQKWDGLRPPPLQLPLQNVKLFDTARELQSSIHTLSHFGGWRWCRVTFMMSSLQQFSPAGNPLLI